MAEYTSISRCVVSFVFVLLTQSILSLVPLFFSASPMLLQLSLTALVIVIAVGLGARCRKLIGLKASAPAFVVFNVLFVWCVYLAVVRPAISGIMDIIFNGEVILILTGLRCIMSSDPGVVSDTSIPDKQLPSSVTGHELLGEKSLSRRRVRYCQCCKAYIKGFDHHCPAFGNCIGQNNYVLFMALLAGFLLTEACYVFCSSRVANDYRALDGTRLESNLVGILASATMLFSLFQVSWQALFLTWHLYCVCFNIKTDEWINWRKYPEFQHQGHCHLGDSINKMQFQNPYDKGIIQNITQFLTSKG